MYYLHLFQGKKNPHFWDKQELGYWSKLALNFQMPFDIPLSIQKTDFSQFLDFVMPLQYLKDLC
jgi:hypothetical protein